MLFPSLFQMDSDKTKFLELKQVDKYKKWCVTHVATGSGHWNMCMVHLGHPVLPDEVKDQPYRKILRF